MDASDDQVESAMRWSKWFGGKTGAVTLAAPRESFSTRLDRDPSVLPGWPAAVAIGQAGSGWVTAKAGFNFLKTVFIVSKREPGSAADCFRNFWRSSWALPKCRQAGLIGG